MSEPLHVSAIIPAAMAGLLKASIPSLPSIIVDTREQRPLSFQHLPSATGTLATADYSIRNLESRFGIERKSCTDLVGSITRERERFARELDRMRGMDYRRLLIVGTIGELEQVRRGTAMCSILASLAAIEARGVPVIWQPDPVSAAAWLERSAWWYWRECLKPAGIKPPTPPWAVESLT